MARGYAVRNAQKRIRSRKDKSRAHAPLARRTVTLISPGGGFPALAWTELEVGSLFRQFLPFLEAASGGYGHFPLDGTDAGLSEIGA